LASLLGGTALASASACVSGGILLGSPRLTFLLALDLLLVARRLFIVSLNAAGRRRKQLLNWRATRHNID
jgi:hypothetical protein